MSWSDGWNMSYEEHKTRNKTTLAARKHPRLAYLSYLGGRLSQVLVGVWKQWITKKGKS